MFRPNMTDLRHLSLTANNISAKLTNQCTQSGLSTFDWQLPFTWLWWWLLLRLLKHQSPLLTTVLLRTTLTWTIKLHYYMLPPGSHHLLYNISIDLSIFYLFSIWSIFNLLHEVMSGCFTASLYGACGAKEIFVCWQLYILYHLILFHALTE